MLHQYLEKPQEVARKLGRINYQIWQCKNCSRENSAQVYICADKVNMDADLFKDAFTDYQKKCLTCQELTITREIGTIKEATRKSQGICVHKYTCQCCQYSYEEERVIPRKVSHTSRKTSYDNYGNYGGGYDVGGGSSFGGGESGGDGAGGSW